MTSRILLVGLFVLSSSSAFARDDIQKHSIEEVLQRDVAKSKLHRSVKLFFGKTEIPVERKISVGRTNKKTNAFNKSDKEACQWAFLSALIQLQKRAESVGADAVINIRSNYKHRSFVSASEFECGAGAMIAGVALVGDIVKLAPTPKASP